MMRFQHCYGYLLIWVNLVKISWFLISASSSVNYQLPFANPVLISWFQFFSAPSVSLR